MHTIFVYGTLLRGLENAQLLFDETLLYKGRTIQPLFLISNLSHIFNKKREGQDEARASAYEPTDFVPADPYPYPFMTKRPLVDGHISARVIGEVYEVSDETLKRLDILEDHPRAYMRQPVDIENIDTKEVNSVDVYMLNSETLFQEISASLTEKTGQYEVVHSDGDWKGYLASRQDNRNPVTQDVYDQR